MSTYLIIPQLFAEEATGYGPIFEEEPVDVVYTEDSPDGRISMNCRARANPPATYRFTNTTALLTFSEIQNALAAEAIHRCFCCQVAP